VWGLYVLKRQSEWGLGERETYESRKGLITAEVDLFSIVSKRKISYNDMRKNRV